MDSNPPFKHDLDMFDLQMMSRNCPFSRNKAPSMFSAEISRQICEAYYDSLMQHGLNTLQSAVKGQQSE